MFAQLTINWDELFLNKNCQSPKVGDNLKVRNNESQLIVNCTHNHPITSLFRGQLYEINEQKRDVYIRNIKNRTNNDLLYGREPIRIV